jgi:hypothetical protein
MLRLQTFTLNSVKNNFVGGTIVSFYNGEPNGRGARNQLSDQIKDKFTGTNNANSIVLNFADSRDRGVEIHTIKRKRLR